MQCCVYAHALSCTEHMSRKRIWSLKWQTKTKKKKLAIYRSWPWISNCWLWDSNSGLSGIEPRALTTRPRRLGANLRRDATSHLLFLNQSVLADFDPRKKKIRILRLVAFQARVLKTRYSHRDWFPSNGWLLNLWQTTSILRRAICKLRLTILGFKFDSTGQIAKKMVFANNVG